VVLVVGSRSSASFGRVVPLPPDNPRRSLWSRKAGNRRVVVQRRPLLVAVADGVVALARALAQVVRLAAKVVVVAVATAALFWGSRIAVAHVLDSPRFALGEIQIGPTIHVRRDEILALAGVGKGARLLAVDTDAVAARIASHPWVAGVYVSRQLPSALRIEVTERRAAAAVSLGALYLIDGSGRPFKRATMDEADGLAVLTGIERAQYVGHGAASEAAFREALAVLTQYGSHPGRPPVSEINIDPRAGFTVYLLEGGAEIRLGRAEIGKKLARLDQIFEAVRARDAPGVGAVRIVHLDGPSGPRVTVKLQTPGS